MKTVRPKKLWQGIGVRLEDLNGKMILTFREEGGYLRGLVQSEEDLSRLAKVIMERLG